MGNFGIRLIELRRSCQKETLIMAQINWLQIWRGGNSQKSREVEKEEKEKIIERRLKISGWKWKW